MLGSKPDNPEQPVAVITCMDQIVRAFLVAQPAWPPAPQRLAEHVNSDSRSIVLEVVVPKRENHRSAIGRTRAPRPPRVPALCPVEKGERVSY